MRRVLCVQGIVAEEFTLHLRTEDLPRVGFAVDHLAMLWCKQLVTLVANSVNALHSRCVVERKVCSVSIACIADSLMMRATHHLALVAAHPIPDLRTAPYSSGSASCSPS
jgi:hypothetical protein